MSTESSEALQTLHRYNRLLPSTHSPAAIASEGKTLLATIIADLRKCIAEYEEKGAYDYSLTTRQIKRLVRF